MLRILSGARRADPNKVTSFWPTIALRSRSIAWVLSRYRAMVSNGMVVFDGRQHRAGCVSLSPLPLQWSRQRLPVQPEYLFDLRTSAFQPRPSTQQSSNGSPLLEDGDNSPAHTRTFESDCTLTLCPAIRKPIGNVGKCSRTPLTSEHIYWKSTAPQ